MGLCGHPYPCISLRCLAAHSTASFFLLVPLGCRRSNVLKRSLFKTGAAMLQYSTNVFLRANAWNAAGAMQLWSRSLCCCGGVLQAYLPCLQPYCFPARA